MIHNFLGYFSKRHLLTNFIVAGIFIGLFFSWPRIKKEELPNFDLNFLVIRAYYPGASPSDVERLVTREIEKEIKGIDGIYEIRSTSTVGICSIRVEFEPGYSDINESIMEIRNMVLGVKLPSEIRDPPTIRIFKTSKKAVIDIGIYNNTKNLLDTKSRIVLQKYAHALENRLVSAKQISEVSKRGYLTEELQINLSPYKLKANNIAINDVLTALKKHNIRKPLGSIDNIKATKITIQAELDTISKLKNLVIRGGFDTPILRLRDVAKIQRGFKTVTDIRKVNGYEAVIFNVYKRSATDIITATKKAIKIVNDFNKTILNGSPIKAILLDDESRDVRNRLSLIGWNGLIGFILILIMLFVFMDFKSGFWVAMGIPFTFAFTFILFPLMGYSINNVTLAAIVIVMGMIVDDAIVVSENITRLKEQGIPPDEAAVKGAKNVFLPVVASILTTCAAFIPLLFFSGRFGRMLAFIPPVVFVMLFGSLIESTIILPAHLNLKIPSWLITFITLGLNKVVYRLKNKRNNRRKNIKKRKSHGHAHWFYIVENAYGKTLEYLLKFRWVVLGVFLLFLVAAVFLFQTQLKFVMFPREEMSQLGIVGKIHKNASNFETARVAQKAENILMKEIGKTVVGFRTSIASSRRGGAADQNRFYIRVELIPKDIRKIPARKLIRKWKAALKKIKELKKFYIAKSRFGQSSGSAVEIIIQENDDKIRAAVAKKISDALEKFPTLSNIEIEQPLRNPEYRLALKRDFIIRLGINPSDIATTMRTILEGTITHELIKGDEEVDVVLSTEKKYKKNIFQILNFPVHNSGQYLVNLNNVVKAKKFIVPNAINRKDFKRTVKVYADLKRNSSLTPIDIAHRLERFVFPKIVKQYPTTIIDFGGEIKDTRESSGDFAAAIILVIFLIYIILALLFNSMTKPLIIMLTIPFGAAGIIIAFWLHGIVLFGIFAAIGALGLAGVVVNDSIVMMDKLEKEYDMHNNRKSRFSIIAGISKTRLRAVLLTTLTTVAGVMPTAYGLAGYDSMLAEMMLGLSWGLLFGTFITLIFVPCMYIILKDFQYKMKKKNKPFTQRI